MEEDPKSFITATWGSVKRGLIGCSAAVAFGLMILVMSLIAVTQPQAASPTPSLSATPTPVAKIEYYLPYPGILPDSPLYRLKALRDKWNLAMTFDPARRAESELLLADKRLNAGMALIEGGKHGLGVTTITKSQKYLEQAANRAVEQAEEGKDVKSFLMQLSKAVLKHEEIIIGLTQKVSGSDSQNLESILTTTRMVQQNVAQALVEE
jgi:hypothetical protein